MLYHIVKSTKNKIAKYIHMYILDIYICVADTRCTAPRDWVQGWRRVDQASDQTQRDVKFDCPPSDIPIFSNDLEKESWVNSEGDSSVFNLNIGKNRLKYTFSLSAIFCILKA